MMPRSVFCVESNCFFAGIQGQQAVLLNDGRAMQNIVMNQENKTHCVTVSFGLVSGYICNRTSVVLISYCDIRSNKLCQLS
jgi:hypothetical protein